MTKVKKEKTELKPLIVTGTLAKDLIYESASKSKIKSQVISLPTQVAALMSTKYIARSLKSMKLEEFNMIIIPGMTFGDAKDITELTGITAFKGSKFAADLPIILDNINNVKLSSTIPACELMKDALSELIKRELLNLKTLDKVKIKSGLAMSIGKKSARVWIGRSIKPCILAEIVDAPKLTDSRVEELSRYFADSGASVIDIGMVSEKSEPNEVRRIIKAVKRAVNNPISIDTSDLEEIKVAVEENVDLILSVNAQNMEGVSKFATDIPVVITPIDEKGICPMNAMNRINQLQLNINNAKSIGFEKIIADPILNPPFTPNLVQSLNGYFEFAKRDSKTPIFFGLGNVTELMDCDSIGINLLLSSIGIELGACIILATEASDKTKGCIKEISTALNMTILAKNRKGPPKDLGFDLLRLKEKRRIEEIYDNRIESNTKLIEPTGGTTASLDPKGHFKIMIDRKERKIVAIYFRKKREKPDIILKSFEPINIFQYILKNELISTMEHAYYIGKELSKAKIALNIGKSYVQESSLFNNHIHNNGV
jgi:dihydropteroate synthase-like protein